MHPNPGIEKKDRIRHLGRQAGRQAGKISPK